MVDFEAFRPTLVAFLGYGDGAKGGRPRYDPVAMLKVLILAAQNNVSDARMEYLIRDRLSWLRFLGFDLGAATPDANTIRRFREKLTERGPLEALFAEFDRRLKARGYLAMGGQIVDATLVAAPPQAAQQPGREGRDQGKGGARAADEIRPDAPARAAQKDTAYRSQSNEAGLKRHGRAAFTAGSPAASRCPRTGGQGQRRQVEGPCAGRTCFRAAEGQDEPVHPHHRHQARHGEGDPGQPDLQHAPPDLPRTAGSDGISASQTRKNPRKRVKSARSSPNPK